MKTKQRFHSVPGGRGWPECQFIEWYDPDRAPNLTRRGDGDRTERGNGYRARAERCDGDWAERGDWVKLGIRYSVWHGVG